MNSEWLLWLSVQVALFSLVGTAMFLLLRRRGPSVAAACAATVLSLTLPLLLVAFSPWPRWDLTAKHITPSVGISADRIVKNPPLDNDIAVEIVPAVETIEPPPHDAMLVQWWRSAVEALRTPPQSADTVIETPPAAWQTWLPWLVAAGMTLGFVRFIVGIWAVRSYRRCSTPVADPTLIQLIHQIAEQVRSTLPQGTPYSPSEESTKNNPVLQKARPQKQPLSQRVHHTECDEYMRNIKLEIRESSRLRSAATIGWRRPVLLLPADWQTWTDTERRVVISHELAHIARQDYLLVLVARFVTAIHFYQPLVLWLARQLRIEQELAADAWAANLTGSRQTYLTTLAQMALRADDQPTPWAARAFLPSAGLLVKRIKWLKRNKTQEAENMNRRSRWILVGTMVAIALFVAGIRGPSESTSLVKAAEPPSKKTEKAIERAVDWLQRHPEAASKDKNATRLAQAAVPNEQSAVPQVKVQLSFVVAAPEDKNQFVPADAKLILSLGPSDFVEYFPPPAVSLVKKWYDETPLPKIFELPLAEVKEVRLIKTTEAAYFDRSIFRAKKPHEWKLFLQATIPDAEQKQFNGKTYFAAKPNHRAAQSAPFSNCYFKPDDRTVIIASEAEMKKMLTGEILFDEQSYQEKTGGPASIWAETAFVKQMLKLVRTDDPIQGALKPVLEKTEWFNLALSATASPPHLHDTIGVAGNVYCKSENDAKVVDKTLQATMTLSRNVVSAVAERQEGLAPAAKFFGDLLDSAKLNSWERYVVLQSNIPCNEKTMIDFLEPLVQSIRSQRDKAMRSQSQGSMKQIALAMHQHLSQKGYYPPEARRDNNGKRLLSWRVALLPYLDESKLYEEFHLGEPWDSEHNRKLISRMPAFYRNPKDNSESTNSSYFMASGKGMFGDSDKGRTPKEIADGFSKTIMVVEAKRDIPWTKPDDVEVDPDPAKPLPKFGGFFDGIFNFAFADGSVRAITASVDPKALHSFFTVAGGEAVGGEALDPPKGVEPKPADGAAMQPAQDAAAFVQSRNNLKQVAFALQNYVAARKTLPPAAIRDKNGKPLLSWRVALLPYLEAGHIYKEFHLDEPWDSEHNLKLLSEMPPQYRCPKADPNSTASSYYLPVGIGQPPGFGEGRILEGAAAAAGGGAAALPIRPAMIGGHPDGLKFEGISDGTAKTIMLIEANRDTPWTKPEDIEIDLDPAKPLPKFGGFFNGTFNVAFADGHVISVSESAEPAVLRAFFTMAGGEPVGEEKLNPPQPKVESGKQEPKPGENDGAAAARQKENIINLKKVGFALHNYASAYRHFPPPVLLGSDGTTKCSWRVLVLPFIDGHKIKTKYRFDEQWDSDNNLKVLKEMPAAYRSPFDAADSTNTSYFMVTGKGTFGDNEEGRVAFKDQVIQEITDGMPNTIMLVEAKRSIPWTKPEDIEIAPNQPLPKLGGFLPGGLFNASFADGSVRTGSTALDEKILRALFSINGGEIVDLKTLIPQPAHGDKAE